MSDPLSLVRQALSAGQNVDYADHHYTIAGRRLHESTKTCFKRTLKGDDYFYTIRDVLFFMENAEMGVAEFRRLCVEKRITAVVEQDKQALKGYLLGEVDSCPQIDLNVAAEQQQAASTSSTTAPHGARATNLPASGTISAEDMQAQMHRHAALMDQSMQRSGLPVTAAASTLSDARVNVKKRKALHLEKSDALDPAFIKADQRMLQLLRADEVAAHTRATVLSKPAADFTFALKLFNDHVLRPKDAKTPTKAPESNHHKHAPAPSLAQAPGTAGAGGAPANAAYGIPIIIVPAVITSIISSLNVRDFLENNNYVSNEVKKAEGAKREQVMLIRRKLPNGQILEYKVIDSVVGFPDRDWDRVVAVFVTGQDWQFNGWKWSKPVELFTKVLGIHVSMDDRVVDPKVLSWNCKILQIKKFKRHYDAGVVNEFWSHVDAFIRTNKPYLQMQPKVSA